MSIFPTSLRATAVDVLSTVSASANAVTNSVDSLALLAATGRAYAADYHESAVRELALTSADRSMVRISTVAHTTATSLEAIANDLLADPKLAKRYAALMAKYTEADKAAVTQLKEA